MSTVKVAINGFGRIGRAVAKRALGLEMKVVAHDPFFFAETALDGQVKMYKELDALLPLCDFITVHVPGDEKTKGLINAERMAKCKKGVRFINCARGGIIAEQALVDAIKNLPEREQYVMSMYYEHDMNLKEIAAVLGVTESRVCQLHSQSIARLRTRLREW